MERPLGKILKNNAIIIILYILMIAGSLWHLLGFFQNTMRIMAAPLLMMIVLFQIRDILISRPHQRYGAVILWSTGVIISSLFVEWVGENTGMVFGNYQYGTTLKPLIYGVPLAIGFAWLNILLASMAVAVKFKPKSPGTLLFLTALFMLLFDVVMEPAAVYLNYWTWTGGHIPLRNFIAWFILGLFYSWTAIKLGIHKNLSIYIFHTFIAQFIYFSMIAIFS